MAMPVPESQMWLTPTVLSVSPAFFRIGAVMSSAPRDSRSVSSCRKHIGALPSLQLLVRVSMAAPMTEWVHQESRCEICDTGGSGVSRVF